jgi:D-erythronate 2-dehydrogenase
METRHWFASPRAAVGFLIHAAELDLNRLVVRSITMPGISATVADEIEALRKVGGEAAVALIRSEPDPTIDALVSTWPKAFNAELALDLGFVPDQSFEEIVAIYREDELGQQQAR